MQENVSSSQGRPAVMATVTVILAIIFGFAGGLVADRTDWDSFLGPDGSQPETVTQADDELRDALDRLSSDEERLRVAAVESALPSVVSVVVSKDMPVFERSYFDPFEGNDFFNGLFGNLPQVQVPQVEQKGTERQQVGAGTGFFVSSDGLIVTNRHVVADEEAEYTVVTPDGEQHEAQVMGRDPSNDLAVLKIDGEDWPALTLSEDEPQVGQSVVAIGYALGQFSNTVSSGIISGLARDITAGDGRGNSELLYDALQTDAAINPGNSGGPLVGLDGKVVGVNVAVEQGAQGIGFALPSSDVLRVVDSVVETGRISRPFLGVRYVMINEKLIEDNQLSVDHGALVVRGDLETELAVMPGSPADLAGIVENDIILELNGAALDEENPLAQAIRDFRAGETVRLKVLHRGEEVELEVSLTERE